MGCMENNLKNFIILFLYCTPASWTCRPEGVWLEPPEYDRHHAKGPKYFSNSSWGGWNPPEGNEDWKLWIEKYGKDRNTDRPASNDFESDPGWPQNWKGYGPGLGGVPPPPWAYVPESYDQPEYCFHRPVYGYCLEDLTRWGFNPTSGKCETFPYSGCGGNQNNFVTKERCVAACISSADPECEDDLVVNFEEMVNFDFNV